MAYKNCLILISLTILWVNATVADEYDAGRYAADEYSDEAPYSAEAPKDTGFVTPLDFSPLFESGAFGAASNPSNHRIRRYTDGRRKKYARSAKKEEDSPYDYRSDYFSRPKDFDSGPYSSNYKQLEKEEDDEAAYDYGTDSVYNNDEYERIKALSEAQAADLKQNPENCKEVKKDSMTCTVCANPKTGGNFESCAYVSEPKNSKYAYLNEKKFDSEDAPDEEEKKPSAEEAPKAAKYETEEKSEPKQEVEEVSVKPSSSKYQSSYKAPSTHEKYSSADSKKPYHGYQREPKEGESDLYKKQYPGLSDSSKSSPYRASEEQEEEEEKKEKGQAYDYKSAIPGFYTDTEPKKDVEHVLAEFKKKDRSACKKVNKNGMTCYQCVDKSGLKHEECMFISESAPKRSHLAYQELKEFTSKPATLNDAGNEEAESQIVTTSNPLPKTEDAPKSAALTDSYGRKLKRKKVNSDTLTTASTSAVQKSQPTQAAQPSLRVARRHKVPITKRSNLSKNKDDPEENAKIIDQTNIAPPEEFAGANSKGAFWAETVPRYSRSLGVTLPEFMLDKSEHEISFDETVAGG